MRTCHVAGCDRLSSEEVTPAVNFPDFTALFKLLDDAREEAASAMLQVQAVGYFADARGLREGGEMREHLFARHVLGVRFFFWDYGVSALRQRINSSDTLLMVSIIVVAMQRPTHTG